VAAWTRSYAFTVYTDGDVDCNCACVIVRTWRAFMQCDPIGSVVLYQYTCAEEAVDADFRIRELATRNAASCKAVPWTSTSPRGARLVMGDACTCTVQ
jgi:hypothetical protein